MKTKLKWLFVVVLTVGVGLGLAACNKGADKKDKTGADMGPDMGAMTADMGAMGPDMGAMTADGTGMAADMAAPAPAAGPLSVEAYTKLVMDLAACKLTESGVDWQCPQRKAMDEALKVEDAQKLIYPKKLELGLKWLTHESAVIRFEAVNHIASGWWNGLDQSAVAPLLKAVATEKELAVLKSMVATLGTSARKYPEIAQWLIKSASTHENEAVRAHAATYLASANKGIAGFLDRLIEMLEKDASIEVRAAVCKCMYQHWDEKVVHLYDKYTKDAKEEKLYSACFAGLVDMWNAYVFLEKPSQKAFQLSLKRLGDKPRTEERPPWTEMDDFGRIPKEEVDKDTKRVPAWYKEEPVVRALLDLAKDPNANWMARTGAAKAIVELGLASEKEGRKGVKEKNKAALEGLRKALEAAKDKDSNGHHVVDTISRELPKLN